jgi:hypothetical protein
LLEKFLPILNVFIQTFEIRGDASPRGCARSSPTISWASELHIKADVIESA